MNLLGLHVSGAQSAAALVSDGEVRFAAAEERFDRVKFSRAFPKRAISFCLVEAGLRSLAELDGIAIAWNPAENMRHINLSGFTGWRRYDPEWLYIVPNQLLAMAGGEAFAGNVLKLDLDITARCPLYFVDHHHAHLAHAICQSPFERGLAVVCDEYGEFYSATIARFAGNRLEILHRIPYPNSLGVFYAAITEHLGFTPNADEWKVMGAAAYGDPTVFHDRLSGLLTWNDKDGSWTLDSRYIEHHNMKRAGYGNEALLALLGSARRNTESEIRQEHFDLAAGAQSVFEERLFQLLRHYARKTGEKSLAASGGCFMNSLANGKIIGQTPLEEVFVPYAAADNGAAMGAALYASHYANTRDRRPARSSPSPFLGPQYSNEEIATTLARFGLSFARVEKPAQEAARRVAGGKLVAWFQGRMEFGERALGHRSILADPRDEGMKAKINAAVKYREMFRPFAPSVLDHRAAEYFRLPPGVRVPYMEQVYPVHSEKAAIIPAVVHRDGTGRLQMVSKDSCPQFHELIEAFDKLTGVPLVLNTSFNVQGEPIVCSPHDAIRTFFTCGLDVLVIGTYVVEKKP